MEPVIHDVTGEAAVVVFRGRTLASCFEQALVLRALAIDHDIIPEPGGFVLAVNATDASYAADQLRQYVGENRDWPPRIAAFRPRSNGVAGAACYGLLLLFFGWLQARHALGMDWLDAGKTNAALVRDGEWWRTVTALTLHLDLGHLAGNLVIGAFFGLLAAELLGAGLAWLTILVSGALGNAMNALVQPPTHTSAGASTAVFAALGLASVYGWLQRTGHRAAFRWAPVVAGAVLLTFFGVGGERTDVVAHLTGFLAGSAMGLLYGLAGQRFIFGRETQVKLGFIAVVILAVSWWFALSHAGTTP